jgi:hypothetical protein
VYVATSNTVTWREEVALHDGGSIVVTWQVRLVPGELGQRPQGGRQRLTFTHRTTGQAVASEDQGKVGSSLNPMILDVDAGRLFLVGLAASGADYDGFGCPMPPYIVFRYDAGAWIRVPLSELRPRFENANLLGFDAEDLIRQSKRFLTATQIAAWYADLQRRADVAHYAFIDRRIRNPLGLGCIRPERVYGAASYERMTRTGS